MTSLIRVDDRDPSIVYSEKHWLQGGVAGVEYNDTTTYPNAARAMATFNFIGTSVSLYGTLTSKSSAVKVQYTIDETVFPMTNYSPYPSNAYQILLFEQWNLSTSSHSFVITILPGSVFDYYLDYLDYTPVESSITTMCPLLSTTTSSIIIPPTVTNSSCPLETGLQPTHKSCDLPYIAVFWSLVAADVLFMLIFMFRKWPRWRTWLISYVDKYFNSRTKIVPFELSESVSVDPTLNGGDRPPSYIAAPYNMAAIQVPAPLFQA
ncbi:hypothetical protein BDQ17DRAFT_1434306 [Cyathus striatus]|nr:hypothetical protein BDQ17DRAFT_1438336 [Cyathus striatus]KAF8989643.1 hypothetical protein BDQ17DRAFT_1434306 [Cyathus striatus]